MRPLLLLLLALTSCGGLWMTDREAQARCLKLAPHGAALRGSGSPQRQGKVWRWAGTARLLGHASPVEFHCVVSGAGKAATVLFTTGADVEYTDEEPPTHR
ncbi:hypothetical protein [Deinococcus navajonensis]|uniref:Uncharacterized protein n=1 Tax=Deinococcus navajonensis TaxID=309884 RepID=A0ABV8XM62_9DEIO